MSQGFLNSFAVIGFTILVVGTWLQIKHTHHQKQVADINGWDVSARTLASILNLITILTTNNSVLKAGQLCLMTSLVIYFLLFGWYTARSRRSSK